MLLIVLGFVGYLFVAMIIAQYLVKIDNCDTEEAILMAFPWLFFVALAVILVPFFGIGFLCYRLAGTLIDFLFKKKE